MERKEIRQGKRGQYFGRINSTKSPAPGAGNATDPRLTSQVGRVRVHQCVSAVGAVEVPVLVCLHSSSSHVTEAGGP
jgi:hypothetical protein